MNTKILTILSNEWINYSAGIFFNMGLFLWLAHVVTKKATSDGAKTFWLAFSIIQLKDILISNTILFDPMFYVAISIFFTQINIVISPIKKLLNKLKQKSYNKYKTCEFEKNKIITQLDELKRDQQLVVDDKLKTRNQEKFLNNLSKKLDSF
jgi:hypothetical protein